ncbi:MAG: hypothetical protein PHT32_08350 [Candidatus Omnitrophica bacterium]|nr:hypothetical protein [Candidatus Omnitrophota bacterium]
MKLIKTVLVLVCLITSLAIPSWGIKDTIGPDAGGKTGIVEYVKNCINAFIDKIRGKEFTAAPSQPLAQPGSYSLIPPRDGSKEESLKGLLREIEKTEDSE